MKVVNKKLAQCNWEIMKKFKIIINGVNGFTKKMTDILDFFEKNVINT